MSGTLKYEDIVEMMAKAGPMPFIPDKFMDALMGIDNEIEFDFSCPVCGKSDSPRRRKHEGRWYCNGSRVIYTIGSRREIRNCFKEKFESTSSQIQVETIRLVCPFCETSLSHMWVDGRLTGDTCLNCHAKYSEGYDGVVDFVKPR